MFDFLYISVQSPKKGEIVIKPKFKMVRGSDLMIRGGDFYAIWVEEHGLWSTDEQDAIDMIDAELTKFYEERYKNSEMDVKVLYMWDADTGSIDRWHKYCKSQRRDSWYPLDEKLIFSNEPSTKEDYVSKKLPYPLDNGDCPAWDTIVGTLYTEEERHKIEWAIGSIVTGDSKSLQKFMVFYGAAGTGKSTILNIIQKLFNGFYCTFDAKSLGSSNAQFAFEPFRDHPLVAIQHDGDLSKIEDNTRINSLVSHESIVMNIKNLSSYADKFVCFLFMGTNKPVRITDAKSGIIRRLIDVSPSGEKLLPGDYNRLVKQVDFELGAIANQCKEVYLEDVHYYDDYIPISMLGASNDFYNFVEWNFLEFSKLDGITLNDAFDRYNKYCDFARVFSPLPHRAFKEELKNYFKEFYERKYLDDGTRVRSYYCGFKQDIFVQQAVNEKPKGVINNVPDWLQLGQHHSILDDVLKDYPAQYAIDDDKPSMKWINVRTTLKDIDTTKVHYVLPPVWHVVIDFDIPDENGNKCLAKNIEAASKWPPTYTEVSKGGQGLHLHYEYIGDLTMVDLNYAEHIEIKKFITDGASLRRRVSICNELPIAKLTSGLPVKGVKKKVIQSQAIKDDKMLRVMIAKNLNKEYWNYTAPSVSFIKHLLDEAYESGIKYDLSDMRQSVFLMCMGSTNQKDNCLKMFEDMKFCSEGTVKANEHKVVNFPVEKIQVDEGAPIVFYDVEVFKNLFVICWKLQGKNNPVIREINPDQETIKKLMGYKLIGFNNRQYDNHIIYGRYLGYNNLALYNLSQSIIRAKKGENSNKFPIAYGLSYTDIYDFMANKMSLKKLEIAIGIHHQELGLDWDQEVPEELWEKVADYCCNDVIATEAAFDFLEGDWIARQIIADLSGLTVNDSTNMHSQAYVFQGNKKPQSEFNYRDLSKPVGSDMYEYYVTQFPPDHVFRVFNADGLPEYRDYIPGEVLPDGWSIMPFFPGYTFEKNISTYLGEIIGEGGRVYSRPGAYSKVLADDIASQHPTTIETEALFGPRYTPRYVALKKARVSVKHGDWEVVESMFDGKLKKYVDIIRTSDENHAKKMTKAIATALKLILNSFYGLTKAKFANPCRDPRNKDNIVAKRGALFMTLLKREVEKQGYTVAHIKTDCIKIPNADDKIANFVAKFGKEYGYDFEVEHMFERFCLVNDAVYIGKTMDGEWIATGTQFKVPYVYKTLFTHEDIEFGDVCETKTVDKGAIYLDMNEKLPDVTEFEKEFKKTEQKYKKGQLSDVEFEKICHELQSEIDNGHRYNFIGRVGCFCPMEDGVGGGILTCIDGEKYSAVTGTKGYRWLESETVDNLGLQGYVNVSYYQVLADEAKKTIEKYCNFDDFVAEEPFIPLFIEDIA